MARSIAILAALVAAACGSTSPIVTAPADAGPALSGTWSGPATDATGPGYMEWALQLADAHVWGTARLVEASTGMSGEGSVDGSFDGTTLTFTVVVPAGAFDPPYAACAIELTGTAEHAGHRLYGSYAGINSCSGPVADGHFLLDAR